MEIAYLRRQAMLKQKQQPDRNATHRCTRRRGRAGWSRRAISGLFSADNRWILLPYLARSSILFVGCQGEQGIPMNKLAIAIAAIAMMAVPATANAAACRDSKGHFIKCAGAAAPAPAASHAAAATHPVAHAAAAPARKTPCRDAKGRFKKC